MKKGKLEVDAVLDEEEVLMAAIEAGCEEMEMVEGDEEGTTIVYSEPGETNLMFEAIKSLGHEPKMNLCYVSKAPVECTEEDFEKNMEIIDALEELDDVDSVEHNMSN